MIESNYLKDNMDFVLKLGKMPVLDLFSEEELKGVLQLSKIQKYDPGELILNEGYVDSWIFFLVSGKVKVGKHGESLTILERTGDVFGEMGFINGSPRSASVYAVDETVCLATDASYINTLSGNERTAFGYILYRIFAEVLANRLRLTSDELIKVKEKNKLLKTLK